MPLRVATKIIRKTRKGNKRSGDKTKEEQEEKEVVVASYQRRFLIDFKR